MTYAQKKAEKELESTVPPAITWTCEEVGQWIVDLGLPRYKDCFLGNFIDGKKLILIDQSVMPKIGVTDYKDMKVISSAIRELLRIEEPDWSRSISLTPRDALSSYLVEKSRTGQKSDALTYVHYLKTNTRYFGEFEL